MSIQWTIVASFLYAEIAVVLLLVLPVASPKRWQGIFRSRFLNALGRQASWYFCVLLFVLVLFLLDAIREMRKYSNADSNTKGTTAPHQLDLEMQVNMRLFRAQRNFYISGFALFLSFVIRRLVILISSLAVMEAEKSAALKQASGASSLAKDLMNSGVLFLLLKGILAENKSNEAHDKEVTELKKQLADLQKELESEKQDKNTLKKQSEALNKEYDRLSDEFNKLEKKLAITSSGDKKDD
ncbi:UNVERIFIED_CONTAM: hypothetical protein PYX00_002509 [Menopon gallinae]|uniref:Endoplasmic reticulum transmembrane protein n=1 Tax=Menopon gallinae TaxID=328185 RepID=A0AAW2IIE9_9NEOP